MLLLKLETECYSGSSKIVPLVEEVLQFRIGSCEKEKTLLRDIPNPFLPWRIDQGLFDLVGPLVTHLLSSTSVRMKWGVIYDTKMSWRFNPNFGVLSLLWMRRWFLNKKRIVQKSTCPVWPVESSEERLQNGGFAHRFCVCVSYVCGWSNKTLILKSYRKYSAV